MADTYVKNGIVYRTADDIPLAPAPTTTAASSSPPPSSSPSSSTSSSTPSASSAGGGSSKGGGGGGGGGGGAPTTYAGYLAAQRAEQKKAEQKAATRYTDLAENLGLLAKALRFALGKKGFKKALKTQLRDLRQDMETQDEELMRGYDSRVASLEIGVKDNEKAADAQSYRNTANAGRERANALSEAMAQGAGESDVLRAQGAAIRNWDANQAEVARNYSDSLSSINASLTDLTTDTRTARVNNRLQFNADRRQLWEAFNDQRSETLTQLGNTYGQQAEYYGLAAEQVGSKKNKAKRKKFAESSGDAFMDSAKAAGKEWDSPPVPSKLTQWTGAAPFQAKLTSGGTVNGAGNTDLAKPEGATLRKWDGA